MQDDDIMTKCARKSRGEIPEFDLSVLWERSVQLSLRDYISGEMLEFFLFCETGKNDLSVLWKKTQQLSLRDYIRSIYRTVKTMIRLTPALPQM